MKIERQLQGTLNTIFTELIIERGLQGRISPYPALEENRADITLKNKNGKPIFFIELKDPTAKDGRSVFDANVLMREVERAQRIDIRYFGNCNFLACAFFDKDKLYEKVSVNEGFFTLADIVRLSHNYAPTNELTTKLRKIADFYLDRALEILERKPIKFADLDELFIFKIRKLIEINAPPISESVWKKYQNNKEFKKEVQKYFSSQLWNIPTTFQEIENLTHISVLMLISKLIFYKTYVDNQTWSSLSPMKVPDHLSTPHDLEELIWQYFKTFQEVTGNFELLIGERGDIIFKIPFVSDAVIDLVREVLDTEQRYDFSKIPFDIIGRIFEELIREDERHKLGQYFTPPHVIDLINAFAIHKSSDKVFDPSCGSGTFLVRAYMHKKALAAHEDKGAPHHILLNEIYGNDLSGYPAYLSMLNLAIRNTRKPSYPRIINKDFFAITEGTIVKLHDQHGNEDNRKLPKFDAIIGNPPYTRQEDIGAMQGTVSKVKIQTLIKSECGFEPSQRTSIYSYFFYHATAFLKDEGYLAFICQNSWLDTDYGIDMQRYLMRNYEIVAIIDSEVERFFPSASVNTTIVILRRQKDEEVRNNNIVKFIWFTSTLVEAIKDYKGVNKFYAALDKITESTTTNHFRINCIQQESLSKHTKWGQFLKAPKVYFDILERGAGKFVPLNVVTDCKFGIKTGADDFFIVKDITNSIDGNLFEAIMNNHENIHSEKKLKLNGLSVVKNGYNEVWLIEEEFVVPCLSSSKDTKQYKLIKSKIPYSVLLINYEFKELKNNFPYVYEYLKHGVRKRIHEVPSCASRTLWYSFQTREAPDISFNSIINDFGKSYLGKVYPKADGLKSIYVKDSKDKEIIWYYLNSTLSWLQQQFIIRSNFGDGAGDIKVYELEDMLIVLDRSLKELNIDLGETKNYKEELGTLESLHTVNPERLKLDSAILEAIGYTNKKEREETLLELYRATYKLIDTRLLKAQSLKGVKAQRNKVEFNIYVDQLKEMLVESKYEIKRKSSFANHLKKLVIQISSDTKLQQKILDAYWKEKYGVRFNQKEIAAEEQQKLF
jgi:type I restriction-modification system DNA methylase subunit